MSARPVDAVRPSNHPNGPDLKVDPGRPSTVNARLTPRTRRKRPKDLNREPEDKAAGIIRCIDAMAVGFIEQQLDTDALNLVRDIELAVRRLRAAALEGLHGYYSNADIAEKLGVSRQAVDQARRRR